MKISEKTQTYFQEIGREFEKGNLLTRGKLEAYWSWWYNRDGEEIIEDGHLWCRDIPEFVKAMRQAGVESFITTNSSTDLMESLHSFAAHGCTIGELCIVKAKTEFDSDKQGIRIKL